MIYYSRSPRSILAGLASLGGLLAIIKLLLIGLSLLNRWFFDREIQAVIGPDKNHKEIVSMELFAKMCDKIERLESKIKYLEEN